MKEKPFFQTIIFIVIGLLSTFILLALKVVFEQTSAEQRLESYGYETLHSYLPYFTPTEDMPVVVVDVGNLEGGNEKFTPRDKLKEVISAIAKENPTAIAVAIDFSTEIAGPWQDPKDPDFFDYCLRLRKEGLPIFIGVERSAQSSPDAWLGVRKYQPLAVGVGFQSPNMDKVILCFRTDKFSECLPSLSLALARSYRESLPQPPALLAPMLIAGENSDQETQTHGDVVFTYSRAIVNYSMLAAIKTGSLSATGAKTIEDNGNRFQNKLVLIGRINNTDDQHKIAIQETPVAGVLLHASATYTLVRSPLFAFTHRSRIVIDILLSLLIVSFVAILRYRNRKNGEYDWQKREWAAVLFTAVLVFVGGIVLIRGMGIIWFDFLVVILALLFHPVIEKKVGARIHGWLGKRDKSGVPLEQKHET